MTPLRELVSRLFRAHGAGIDEELRTHLELLVEENLERGLPLDEARRQARLALGGAEQIKEAYRDQRGLPWLESVWQDLRYAARAMRSSPGFTAVALLTLALGIGANTAIFSVLYGAWLAPLNYVQPQRLVDVSVRNLDNGWQTGGTSWPTLLEWRAQNHVFTGLGAHRYMHYVNLTGGIEPEEVIAHRISADLFPLLGVSPAMGRGLPPEGDQVEGPHSVLLSHAYWQSRFGGDPKIIGRTITIDGEPFTVAGVMPKGFEFPPASTFYKPAVWLSLNLSPDERAQEKGSYLDVAGRLKPGVMLGQAQAEMETIVARLAASHPKEQERWGALVTRLDDTRTLRQMKPTLLMLAVAVALVLLIACANVANLLLVRAAGRRREFAIRLALGVSRARLSRQLLTESCLLSLVGCGLGVGVAAWGVYAIQALLPRNMPRMTDTGLQPAVLLFSLGCALACGILFGMLPAWRAGRVSIEEELKQSTRSVAPRNRLARVLVTVEVALALVLLAGAGLVVESFRRVTNVELGFDREHVLTARIQLPKRKYAAAARILAFRDELLRRVKALPGVVAAGTVDAMPMGIIMAHTGIEVEGRRPDANDSSGVGKVSADYLKAMGIRLQRGRYFNQLDRAETEKVVIVSEKVARRFWPHGEALGQRVRLSYTDSQDWYTIVGVVNDVREFGADRESRGDVYVLNQQLGESAQQNMTARLNMLAARTSGEPLALANAIRGVVRDIDPEQPVADVMTTEQLVDRSIAGRKLNALLLGVFSALALVLAAIGLFGVVAYMVAGRTNEIGIRIALGASPAGVARLVARDSAAIALIGIVLGGCGAAALTRLLERFLYGVRPGDPGVLACVAALLLLVVGVATAVPVRRALRVDPITALREE
jgi:putative ABC transport system permease protein